MELKVVLSLNNLRTKERVKLLKIKILNTHFFLNLFSK